MKVRVLYHPGDNFEVVYPQKHWETEEELEAIFAKANRTGAEYDDMDSEEPIMKELPFCKGNKNDGLWVDQAKKIKMLEASNNESLIQEKIRELAISELKKDGKISNDYN